MNNSYCSSCMFCLLYCRLCPLFKLMCLRRGPPWTRAYAKAKQQRAGPLRCRGVSNHHHHRSGLCAKEGEEFFVRILFKKKKRKKKRNYFDNMFFTCSIEFFTIPTCLCVGGNTCSQISCAFCKYESAFEYSPMFEYTKPIPQ